MDKRAGLVIATLVVLPLAACSHATPSPSPTTAMTPTLTASTSAPTGPAATVTTPTAVAPSSSTSHTSAPAPSGSATAPAPSAQLPGVVDAASYQQGANTYFVSPAGDVHCAWIGTNPVGCQTSVPVAGSTCGTDPNTKATMASFDAQGKASIDCTTQGVYRAQGAKVLPAGSTITVGKESCLMSDAGVACTRKGPPSMFTLGPQSATAQ